MQPWRRRKRGLSRKRHETENQSPTSPRHNALRWIFFEADFSIIYFAPDNTPPADRLRAALPVGTNRAP